MSCAYNAKYNSPEWIGKKFNHLTVIEPVVRETHNGKQWFWKCKCDCGKETVSKAAYIITGHTKTCGCGKNANAVKHNRIRERLYIIWSHMLQRCELESESFKKTDAFRRYRGRGIKVCNEWHDFRVFAEWAKNSGYTDELSIERIDNDGDYCPENCKWIERSLQARNRCTTLYVEYKGKRMSLAEACELANMPYKQVFSRIKYGGWSVENALTIPMKATMSWKRSERFNRTNQIQSDYGTNFKWYEKK